MLIKRYRKDKENKIPVMKIGTNKKCVIALWIILIGSVSFGVYKNFTAIDKKTVYEKEIIEEKIIDTNSIENFVKQFAKEYYSWENNSESINNRTTKINSYLTEELQLLNKDTIRPDISTTSSVNEVQIWKVEEISDNEYEVIYCVDQSVKEGEEIKYERSSYEVVVKVDDSGNMIIIKNPTISNIPGRLEYKYKKKETDETIDSNIIKEVTEFLNTFFKLYPTATVNELSYYANENILKPINKEYIFSELVDPIFRKEGKNIKVSTSVKYIDQITKAIQISQYEFTLAKDENWKIIK